MKQKTILITGASSGIGRETALLFAKKGWNVIATMRDIKNKKYFDKFSNIDCLTLDVTNIKSIEKAIDDSIKNFGKIDVLLNNAGYGVLGTFECADKEVIYKQIETNLIGVMSITQKVLPYMRQNKQGIICTISSMAGLVGFPLHTLYCASKWGIEGFSESLRYELKPYGIKVKIIEPGMINSDFHSRSLVKLEDYNLNNKGYEKYNNIVIKNCQKSLKNAPDAIYAAKKIFKAINDPSSRLRYKITFMAKIITFIYRVFPNWLFFKILRSTLEKGYKKNGGNI